MPKTFLKPLDYSIDLLVRSHPTLREYVEIRARQTEVDPDFALSTRAAGGRQRIEPRDEIMLRNNVGNSQNQGVAMMNLTRSISGAFVNTVDVVTQYLPGNFGVRVIETLPTNLSEVWRERKSTQVGTSCLQFMDAYRVPQLLEAAQAVDALTDEESDDGGAGFAIKIPELADLVVEFEKDDDTLFKAAEIVKQVKADHKAKGLEWIARDVEIKDDKKEKIAHLDQNISVQREEWTSRLPGMLEDINETIKDPRNKIYLR